MTAPQIGNYGVASGDAESQVPRVAGFVMREASPLASNWRADGTLRDYLVRHNIVAIADIDTRALTRVLRSAGVMRGIIATGQVDPDELVEKARAIPKMEGSDLVSGVTCDSAFEWREPRARQRRCGPRGIRPAAGAPRRQAAARGRLRLRRQVEHPAAARRLRLRRARVSRRPRRRRICWRSSRTASFSATAPAIRRRSTYAIDNVRELVQSDVPMFGICLGHQILGLAVGGETFKLKFGHRGANHPVKELSSGKVEITSQNHGFAVNPDSLPSDVSVTHLNLYDGTVEGFRHTTKPIFSVQYHPEASPGPHDADYLFRQFLESMEKK